MNENIETLMNQIQSGDSNYTDTFAQIMAAKVSAKLEDMRIDVANRYFNNQNESLSNMSEGKMKDLYSDIEDTLSKHVQSYKSGSMDADTLGSKTIAAHAKIAKLHNISIEHAKKFVNDYVDSQLKEDVKPSIEQLALKSEDLNEMFTRQHMIAAAKEVAKESDPVIRQKLHDHHAKLFAASNPRFDANKFKSACGV